MIKTSHEELRNFFRALKIPRGSVVMVHSALFSLGIIEGGVAGFYRALREHVGENATIVVPTFTYSFRRNQIFDIRQTPSALNIGVFSEYVRMLPGSIRSADPLFSMSAIGAEAADLMRRTTTASFGIGSIYDRLFDHNAYFVAIGITYSTGLAGFMNLEKLAEVPYRKEVECFGRSVDQKGNVFNDSALHYQRNEEIYGEARTDREQMGELLERAGTSMAIEYGYGRHMCLAGCAWREQVLEILRRDPFFMLDKTQYPLGRIPGGIS